MEWSGRLAAAALIGFHAVGGGSAQSLPNGSFARRTEAGAPQGWRVGGGVGAYAEPTDGAPGGTALRMAIDKATPQQGEVIQSVRGLAPNTRYVLRGQLRSTTAGAGFLQVKRYRGGKEVERISSKPSPTAWETREVVFETQDADRIDVLCRTNPSERHVGSSVWFAGLEIAPKPRAPLAIRDVRATPTLHAVGVAVGLSGDWTPEASMRARYRAAGDADWTDALPLVARPSEAEFRGSVFDLKPDTGYELEVFLAPDPGTRRASFRTWPRRPPTGETRHLDDLAGLTAPHVLNLRGTPDAWVLVRPRPGTRGLIEASAGATHALAIEDAAYVVVEGFTIRGGDDDAVRVQRSQDVLLVGCDIAGWGIAGAPNEKGVATNAAGKVINMQSGISVQGAVERIRLERNFIHAPRGSANSWQHGHPHGPNGINLHNPLGNILVLDNDIIGDEAHWWNDGIEGEYNAYVTGGPHRDTDYEGNTIAFGNDDGMELDGGQINVRSVRNLIRWTFCGVSCAPNRAGPSYVVRNVIALGDSRGQANFGLKMGGFEFPEQGLSHLLHNTVVSHGEGLSGGHYGNGPNPMFARRNVFHLGGIRYPHDTMVDFDEDVFPPNGLLCRAPGQERRGVAAAPRFVDEAHGDYRLAEGSAGRADDGTPDAGAWEWGAAAEFPPRGGLVVATPALLAVPAGPDGATVSLTVAAEAGATWTATPNSPWLRAEPASGPTGGGAQTVRFVADASRLSAWRHRGAVTFRTDRGHLRTVFVTASGTVDAPVAIRLEAEAAAQAGFEVGSSPVAGGGRYLVAPDGTPHRAATADFEVEIPSDGVYELWARVLCEGPDTAVHDSFFVSVDGAEPGAWHLVWRAPVAWAWQHVSVSGKPHPMRLELAKGRHRVRFLSREPRARLDAIHIGNLPPEDGYMFEP